MGSSSSKFRKHLQNGDEYAALQLFNSSSDLRKDLDPNSSYGDTYSHDSPMHYAARHAMKSLLRIFLFEYGGNPNKKNGRNETSLHCVCIAPFTNTTAAIQRRVECLMLILQWRGATHKDGEVEKADLAAQDEKDNTALHYAAASGLKRCVELLVTRGAPLFKENAQKQTPCDCAEKNTHSSIALYLESKMVFSNEDDNDEAEEVFGIETEELYSGLRAQDLQEAKDQLLVETADMLRVPLFTAEALLRNHEWSREMLLEVWMEDPFACCHKCGVVPPATLFSDRQGVAQEDEFTSPTPTSPPEMETVCDICACLIPPSEPPVPIACDHQFCRSCWERYLTGKIKEGEAHNITCPGYGCSKLVPVEIIETLVSRDMARRYLQFDIKAFVESNPQIKWCPYPGCGRAVKLPDSDNPLSPTFRDPNQLNASSDFSHAVDCGNGHTFCWECLGEAHEPASCEHWKLWHQKVADVKPEELSGTEEETEMAANCLWLITNSKNCPNCKSPIQKNEGCNHMKCSKCKHDFCWVCLEAWKKHSSATGGYFRCNRYEVVRNVENQADTVKSEAEARNKRMQDLNKFVHYYTRFKNHENSYQLEQPLLSSAKEKMMVLARAVTDAESALDETRFVENAVRQLLQARRVLKCCYVYGYYLEETGYKKPIFEFMQTELEECTETLSEMIARPYLRTPRNKIIQTAHLVQRKRHEFVTAIAKGLVPDDTSPNQRRHKRNKYSIDLDEDLKKALLASLQDINPQNSWVKDRTGRHTNLSALFDWPEDSDDSDTETTPQPSGKVCMRKDCQRACVQNPRTGHTHNHCSMRCFRMDQLEKTDGSVSVSASEYFDYQIEMLRALEMSRLEFQREMGTLQPGMGDRSPCNHRDQRAGDSAEVPPPHSPIVLQSPPKGRVPRGWGWAVPGARETEGDFSAETDVDFQDEERELRMAIQLSLQENMTSEARHSPTSSSLDQPNLEAASFPATEGEPSESLEGLASDSSQQQQQQRYDYQCHPSSRLYYHHHQQHLHQYQQQQQQQQHQQQQQQQQKCHGACGSSGLSEGASIKMSRSHDREMFAQTHPPHIPVWETEGPSQQHNRLDPSTDQPKLDNTFGLIKDLSVTNILPSTTDKMKDFEKKNFSQIYFKKHPTAMQKIETVFEPRPPYLLSSQEEAAAAVTEGYRHLPPPPPKAKEQCLVDAGCCSTTKLRCPRDEYPVITCPRDTLARSQGDSNSPREPSLSRSPRELDGRDPRDSPCWVPRAGPSYSSSREASRSPRDLGAGPSVSGPSQRDYFAYSPRTMHAQRAVFTFEPYATAGSVPDLITSCPARCLAAPSTSSHHPVTTAVSPGREPGRDPDRVKACGGGAECLSTGFETLGTLEDDDPGPRLDAVLRSLQKLSTRLGEDDEFLSSFSNNQDPNSTEDEPHQQARVGSTGVDCDTLDADIDSHSEAGSSRIDSGHHQIQEASDSDHPNNSNDNLLRPSALATGVEPEDEDNAVFV